MCENDFYNAFCAWKKIKSGELPDGTIFARGEMEFPAVEMPPSYSSLLYKWPEPSPLKAIVKPTPVIPEPTRILLSGNRTIVFWNDGTKTIVKQSPTEQYSVYAAFTAALAIKLYGSNSKLKKILREKVEVQKTKEKTPKEEPIKPKDFSIGSKVRVIDNELHERSPQFYPPKGTVGVYTGDSIVQWPAGSTSSDDCWCFPHEKLELVEE